MPMISPSAPPTAQLNLQGLIAYLRQLDAFRQLAAGIAAGETPAHPLGIVASARSYAAAGLVAELQRPALLLTARAETAVLLAEQLRAWLGADARVFRFADPDALPFERIPWARETRQARLAALTALTRWGRPGSDKRPPVVVASVRALMQKTAPPALFRQTLHTLRRGEMVDLRALLARWLLAGYEHASVVEAPGQFSRRGGILDIWPANEPWPVRIELWGDELDSLRRFDPATQRTLPNGRIERLLLSPASEALLTNGPTAARRLRQLDYAACHPPAQLQYEQDIEQLGEQNAFRGVELYIPYLYQRPAALIDYLPQNALLLIDAAADAAAVALDLAGQAGQVANNLIKSGELPPDFASSLAPWPQLAESIQARGPIVLGQGKLDGHSTAVGSPLGRLFHPGPRWGGQLRRVVEQVAKLQKMDRVAMVSRQAPRLADLFIEDDLPVSVQTDIETTPPRRSITLVQGMFDGGWRLSTDAESLHFLTDAELFGWGKARRRRSRQPRRAAPESFFADIQPGDYVVHMEHGVGRFAGLVKVDLDGAERDYLLIEYAKNDKLYVPVHQADRLARYVGPGSDSPQLNRLGTADWEMAKRRTRRAVAAIAQDLLALYAQRETLPGHAFAPDSEWQQELEASFPYIETNDQLVAIEAVKQDMEKPQPMDRLICGDVGYGKTEVALRAAFKAIMDGKQVAVLVPTTVLAQQHFKTFSRRLSTFPVQVAMLSRFRTRKQQQETLSGLLKGSVDIVIGTHRLLSKDVEFKHLGLLIVDEEQRFGVKHKEKIKQLRTQVDVLTLTATPIPRTLYMSLTGVRDLSTIETPPMERLSIQTQVSFYDETLIRNAILRELDRGGQVFFVHNRVRGIEQIASKLRKLVPEARIAVGHGQMPERELERVMLAFAEGEYDVLVSTTIIESGIDIPNANTIIINRADKFGLAQLYQLRGRVGRSAVRAYAYLLHDKHSPISPEARRRLEAIQEASDLGSGFRIAMRDLEIRGAGDLLGARQHGHIAAVGFDMYVRLLAQAVEELREQGHLPETVAAIKGLLAPLSPSVQLDLPLDAGIPRDYIENEDLRLQLYRRIAGLGSLGELDDMAAELADRFGSLPERVQDLLLQVKVKLLASRAGVTAIGRDSDQIVVHSPAVARLPRQELQHHLGDQARVGSRAIWVVIDDVGAWRERLLHVLDILSAGVGLPPLEPAYRAGGADGDDLVLAEHPHQPHPPTDFSGI